VNSYQQLTFEEAGQFLDKVLNYCKSIPVSELDLDLTEMFVDFQVKALEGYK
jgi:hypothetical protein